MMRPFATYPITHSTDQYRSISIRLSLSPPLQKDDSSVEEGAESQKRAEKPKNRLKEADFVRQEAAKGREQKAADAADAVVEADGDRQLRRRREFGHEGEERREPQTVRHAEDETERGIERLCHCHDKKKSMLM